MKTEAVIMKRILETDRDATVPDQWEAQILCRILTNHHVIMVGHRYPVNDRGHAYDVRRRF